MDRRNLMADAISGGGMEMTDLPLVYEHTLTERALKYDTGKVFRCDKKIVVDIVIPKDTQGTGTKGMFLAGCHTDTKTITSPWENILLITQGIDSTLEYQYGCHIFIEAIKMPGGRWVSTVMYANLVNPTQTRVQTTLHSEIQYSDEAITGFCFGNGMGVGDKQMAVGTTIKVWGR